MKQRTSTLRLVSEIISENDRGLEWTINKGLETIMKEAKQKAKKAVRLKL